MVQEKVQINERKVRLIAFMVFVLALYYLISNAVFVPIFLVVDFLLRSFGLGKFSLLALFSDQIIRLLQFSYKPVFYPPKRFATRIGLVFSLLILTFHLFDCLPFLPAYVLAFFAFLESFFGFCAGCYIYNFFVRK